MWDYRHAELLAEQTHRDEFTDAGHTDSIHLNESGAPGLQIILEHDAVRDVFPEGELARRDCLSEDLVTVDVVGVRWFFDPKWIHSGQPMADVECLGQSPLLVRIQHDSGVMTRGFANDVCAPNISFWIARTNLEFHRGESAGNRALAVFSDLVVIIVKPADGRIVTRITGVQYALSRMAAGLVLSQELECCFCREFVVEIGKVERGDDFFGRKIEQQFPQRDTASFGPQVPAGVCDRSERQLHDTFVRTEPAELLFISHLTLEYAKPRHELFDGLAHQPLRVKTRRLANELVACTKCESQPDARAAAVVMQLRNGV